MITPCARFEHRALTIEAVRSRIEPLDAGREHVKLHEVRAAKR